MTSSGIGVGSVPGAWERLATRAAFFVAGFATASWAPLVPLAKARIGLDEGGLGGLLLCLGLGSVCAMPFSGGFAARFGCRKAMLFVATLALLALPMMATAPTAASLAAVLFLFGAGVGVMDVVMNIQAVIVEKASGKAMMSGFHGMYSVGGIAGAGGMTALLSFGLSPLAAIAVIVAIAAIAIYGTSPGMLPYGGEEDSPAFALPRGPVLLLGALCFILFLAEGAVLDWSGVLLNAERGLDRDRAGLGYAAFATTMTLGRLFGDSIVRFLGPRAILFLGGLCAASGFALAALVPSWPVAILGFALVGVGASNVVPVMFSAAGRQTAMPSNLAVAAVTTMGYAGILAGPALIGFAAHGLSLPTALLLVAILLLAVAFSARAASRE